MNIIYFLLAIFVSFSTPAMAQDSDLAQLQAFADEQCAKDQSAPGASSLCKSLRRQVAEKKAATPQRKPAPKPVSKVDPIATNAGSNAGASQGQPEEAQKSPWPVLDQFDVAHAANTDTSQGNRLRCVVYTRSPSAFARRISNDYHPHTGVHMQILYGGQPIWVYDVNGNRINATVRDNEEYTSVLPPGTACYLHRLPGVDWQVSTVLLASEVGGLNQTRLGDQTVRRDLTVCGYSQSMSIDSSGVRYGPSRNVRSSQNCLAR